MDNRAFSTVGTDHATVVSTMLQASRRQDWDTVRDCLHPDVVWTLPGTSQVSGRIHGRDDVVATAQVIDGARLTVEPQHILFGYGTVIATIHNTASHPVDLDEWLALVFEVRDGVIVSIATHLSDVPGLDRFYAALSS